MTAIRVGHLYPGYLNIYADRGNIAVLARRAAWRGHELVVTELGLAEAIVPGAHDLYYVGGGQDREQLLVAGNLAGKAEPLKEAVLGGGAALLAVCGGYQLLGRGYRGLQGEDMPGVGLLPLETVAGSRASRTTPAARASTPAPSRSAASSPASETTGRAATRAAGSGARSARTCTARCCRATPGSPTGCSRRRSRTARAASRPSSPRCRTSSSRARTRSPPRGRAPAADDRVRSLASSPAEAAPDAAALAPSRVGNRQDRAALSTFSAAVRSGCGTSPLPW